MDFYNDGVKITEERDLAVVDLKAGENQITAEVIGRNKRSTNTMLGLDYLMLKNGE